MSIKIEDDSSVNAAEAAGMEQEKPEEGWEAEGASAAETDMEEKNASQEAEASAEEETVSGEEEIPEAEEKSDDAQSADAGSEPAQDAEGQTEKRRLFGRKDRKDKKDREIEDLKGKVSELSDRVKRDLAEFDNFRKRTEKEKAAMFDMGAKSMIEKILPLIDNFERGLAAVPEDRRDDPFVDGMDKVYRQMLKDLGDAGLKPIEAVGQPFDPNLHNAVMHIEDENLGENVVAQEFQKGYTYKGTVVRHSMVQVAN